MRLLRKCLILCHRYLGIPLSFVFAVWFLTGIGMIYVGGMPELTAEARLEHLAPLDLAAVRLTPRAAAERSDLGPSPATALLLTVQRRPAYRFSDGPFGATTIFADDGQTLGALDRQATQAVAADFLGIPSERLRFARTLEEPDQWTLLLGRELPLDQFIAEDAAGTVVYVSPQTAEVVLATTRRMRALAWIATIPHWLYFTPLRVNQPVWYWTVVWLAALGCVLAALGLVLGIVQFRKSTPFKLSASIRYSGWMRWHYILGSLFGLFALTWVFSGLLSMEPFAWTNAQGLAAPEHVFSGGRLQLGEFGAFRPADWAQLGDPNALKEIEFRRIEDAPYYLARYARAQASPPPRERPPQASAVMARAAPGTLLIDADTLRARSEPFSVDSLLERLHTALPDERIAEHELLTNYDAYYYSRSRQAPLPVLRVKFDDPMRTWFYIDPALGRVVATVHRFNRLERWLYNGLHSLDFAFWYGRRPLWDIVMIGLLLGALSGSLIGLVFGLKRLAHDLARLISRRQS